jgi:ATP-dependent DNA ligase
MLAYPFEERRLFEPKFGWKFPVIVQPKLDGERAHPIPNILPDIELISSECNLIQSVPHINQAFKDQKIDKELDGELYVHGMDFSEIHSIVSRKSAKTIHPQAHKMQFHVFDLVSSDNQVKRLTDIPELEPPLFIVPSHVCTSMKDIMLCYDIFLSGGYEGIIIRHAFAYYERKRSRFIMKFKPKKTDDYEIRDCIQAISKDGEDKAMLGAFLCVGVDGTEFKVGAGSLTHDQRYDIWNEHCFNNSIVGKFCRVQYQNITSKGGVPRFGLALEVID